MNLSANWGRQKSETEDKGSSIATNTAREDGSRIFQNAVTKHSREVKSNRENAIEETMEQTVTTSVDETERVSYENMNEGSSLNIEYREYIQQFVTVISLQRSSDFIHEWYNSERSLSPHVESITG